MREKSLRHWCLLICLKRSVHLLKGCCWGVVRERVSRGHKLRSRMAMPVRIVGTTGAGSSCSVGNWGQRRKSARVGREVRCAAAGFALLDQYRMLRVQPGASEKEVKKAFRKLALQYHPDVCKGNNCGVQFHRINEAYDIVISSLRQSEEQEQWQQQGFSSHGYSGEETAGLYDSEWDLWEEWMGWEGAGIRDYSSHINPYI